LLSLILAQNHRRQAKIVFVWAFNVSNFVVVKGFNLLLCCDIITKLGAVENVYCETRTVPRWQWVFSERVLYFDRPGISHVISIIHLIKSSTHSSETFSSWFTVITSQNNLACIKSYLWLYANKMLIPIHI
jgi:hypothetical protein